MIKGSNDYQYWYIKRISHKFQWQKQLEQNKYSQIAKQLRERNTYILLKHSIKPTPTFNTFVAATSICLLIVWQVSWCWWVCVPPGYTCTNCWPYNWDSQCTQARRVDRTCACLWQRLAIFKFLQLWSTTAKNMNIMTHAIKGYSCLNKLLHFTGIYRHGK